MDRLVLGIFDDPKKRYEKPDIQPIEMDDEGGLGDSASKEGYPHENW